jgi:hypothetical protein
MTVGAAGSTATLERGRGVRLGLGWRGLNGRGGLGPTARTKAVAQLPHSKVDADSFAVLGSRVHGRYLHYQFWVPARAVKARENREDGCESRTVPPL